MGVKEKELQTVSTIADNDKMRIVTSDGGSKSVMYSDLQNRIKESVGGSGLPSFVPWYCVLYDYKLISPPFVMKQKDGNRAYGIYPLDLDFNIGDKFECLYTEVYTDKALTQDGDPYLHLNPEQLNAECRVREGESLDNIDGLTAINGFPKTYCIKVNSALITALRENYTIDEMAMNFIENAKSAIFVKSGYDGSADAARLFSVTLNKVVVA